MYMYMYTPVLYVQYISLLKVKKNWQVLRRTKILSPLNYRVLTHSQIWFLVTVAESKGVWFRPPSSGFWALADFCSPPPTAFSLGQRSGGPWPFSLQGTGSRAVLECTPGWCQPWRTGQGSVRRSTSNWMRRPGTRLCRPRSSTDSHRRLTLSLWVSLAALPWQLSWRPRVLWIVTNRESLARSLLE